MEIATVWARWKTVGAGALRADCEMGLVTFKNIQLILYYVFLLLNYNDTSFRYTWIFILVSIKIFVHKKKYVQVYQ